MTASSTSPGSLLHLRVFGARPFHGDGELLALRFTPDGNLLSLEEPGVLRHWDFKARRQIGWHELAGTEAVWCFSPAAHYIAAGSDELCLWETNNGELLACWPQASWVTAFAFQPGGILLASGHDDGNVRIWDYASGHLAYEFHPPNSPSGCGNDWAVSALAFSPDGRTLAVAAENRIIALWNVASGARFAACWWDTPTASPPWPGIPTAGASFRPGGTPRRACGTQRLSCRSLSSTATTVRCRRWHSLQTAASWPASIPLPPSICGK